MTVRPVPDAAPGEPGRRLVIERPPVYVDDVTDFDVDDKHDVYVFSRGKPSGWFAAGTATAVYYADAAVQAQAG